MVADTGQSGGMPVDPREGVIWAYRLLLGREPNDEHAVAAHLAANYTVSGLRDAFMGTAEYRQSQPAPGLSDADAAVIGTFAPFCSEPAPAGSWHDFMGVRTRCSFLPDGYVSLSGKVQGPPGSADGPIHDVAEWVGTLRSVIEARGRLTVVELGAGWAPWLVASAVAATRRGIGDVRLIGVEGSSGHVEFMRQHFIDNGISPDAHRLIHAVAGAFDGVASFPKLAQPNNNYGAQAAAAGAVSPGTDPTAGTEMEEVPSLTLQTLLADVDRVDLMHVDVQGAEAEVLTAGREVLDRKVHRIVIGTHARGIEAELLDLFASLRWVLEDEASCRLLQGADGAFNLLMDGTQVWRNPRV